MQRSAARRVCVISTQLQPNCCAGNVEVANGTQKSGHLSHKEFVDRATKNWSADHYSHKGPRPTFPQTNEFFGETFYRLSRFADVKDVLEHPSKFSAKRLLFKQLSKADPVIAVLFRNWLLAMDPPRHHRLRRALSPLFTRKAVNSLQPKIQALTEQLIHAAVTKASSSRRFDLVSEISFPLPCLTILALLGLPSHDLEKIKRFSFAIAGIVGGLDTFGDIAGMTEKHYQDLHECSDYLSQHIRETGKNLDKLDTIFAAMIRQQNKEIDDPELAHEELLSNCAFMIFAGHETTTNFIGNSIYALLSEENAGVLKQIYNDIDNILPMALEECLRLHSPVQAISGQTVEEHLLAGNWEGGKGKILQFSPGSRYLLQLGKANRDPAQFPNPEKLVLHRKNKRHVAFSRGRHACLGRNLARLEGFIAVKTLLTTFKGLRLAPDQTILWRKNMGLKGLETLYVEYDETH